METLFNIEPMDKKPPENTCRDCENRQRWQCNSKVFSYCAVRKSNRTNNGLLKIKAKDKACSLYKKEN